MGFESAEKRVEICVRQESLALVDLRRFDSAFWQARLATAGAFILSKMRNELCDAYVLSESSLFVWQDRVLLITCGNTSLVDAALEIVTAIGSEHLQSVSYRRQNEVFGHRQSSSFAEDLQCLSRVLSGEAYRLGNLDGHHHYVFYHGHLPTDSVFTALQLYQINGEFSRYLQGEKQDKQAIFAQLQLDELLPEFSFDTYLFTPCGYSLNGIHQGHYFTLHITPQLPNAYLSLETNLADGDRLRAIVTRFLTLFCPSSWDLSGWDATGWKPTKINRVKDDYLLLYRSLLSLDNRGIIYTEHYRQGECETIPPVVLTPMRSGT